MVPGTVEEVFNLYYGHNTTTILTIPPKKDSANQAEPLTIPIYFPKKE